MAAGQYAKKYGISIQLEPGGEGSDPLKLVRNNDFGVASADEIIRAIDKGVDVRIIGVAQDQHPAAFAALASSGISKPKDFEGKRVGLLGFGATGLIYAALCKNAGVDRSKVTEVVVSPDIRPFIAGKVNDVQPIFIYDEPVTLDEQHIKYSIVDPRDYGVHFKGQAYFTTTSTIHNNPNLVRNFLSAELDGWTKVASDPESAIAALHKIAPSADLKRERELLKRGIVFFVPKGHQVLMSDPQTWGDMIRTLRDTNSISQDLGIDQVLDLEPLKQVYASRKPLS